MNAALKSSTFEGRLFGNKGATLSTELAESHLETLESLQKALSFDYSISIGGHHLVSALCKLAVTYGSIGDDEADSVPVAMSSGWPAVADNLIDLGEVIDQLKRKRSLHEKGTNIHRVFIQYDKRIASGTKVSYLFGYLLWRLFLEVVDVNGRAKSALEKHATDLWLAVENFNNTPKDYRSEAVRTLAGEIGDRGAGYENRVIEALSTYAVKETPKSNSEYGFINSIKSTLFFKSRTVEGGQRKVKIQKGRGQSPPPPPISKKPKKKPVGSGPRALSRRLTDRALRVTVHSPSIWNIIEKGRFVRVLSEVIEGGG